MSTEAGIETVPISAEDDQPMHCHRVCGVCYPEPVMGDLAVCGEKILGIPPRDKDRTRICVKCVRAWRPHVFRHLGYGSRG